MRAGYKEKNMKSVIILIVSFMLVYTIVAFDIVGRIGEIVNYSMYDFIEKSMSHHFNRFVAANKNKSVKLDEIFIEGINNQMYGMEYLYREGQKQMLVSDNFKYLLDCIEYDKDMTVENEGGDSTGDEKQEECVETTVLARPENGITYSMEQLKDFSFLISHMYIVPSRALVLESDLVAEEMLKKDMTIKGDNKSPQILVYHTHSQEAFADSAAGGGMTIVQVGDYLTELLRAKGFNVIHCTESFDVTDGKLNRSNAYTKALPAVQQILEDNPSIEVVLDIHRDGLPENAAKLVTDINGKQTAKIMFFNGVSRSSAAGEIDYLYNRYRSDNLALSFQAKLKAMEYYPDFTRKNYIDAYQYNQHVIDKAMLVEVGAQNNDFIEAKNAMEPLSEILYMLFSGKD